MVAGVNLLYHSFYVLSLLFGFEKTHRFLKFHLEKDLIESFYDHLWCFLHIFFLCAFGSQKYYFGYCFHYHYSKRDIH